MKIIIAAGGTGGHFYPGLAVAKEWLGDGHHVSFIVKKGDYVLKLLEKEGLPFNAIFSAGFRRSLHPVNVISLLKIIFGFFESLFLFIRFKPQLLLVMGGFLSVPPACAARLFGIPILLHEQNVRPGLANRLLFRIARKVALSFEQSLPFFFGIGTVTGNPVRPEFKHVPAKKESLRKFGLDPGKKTVLVFGGSLGAHTINQIVVESFKLMKFSSLPIQVLHITGQRDREKIKSDYQAIGFQGMVLDYCHTMTEAYAAADFVVSRAGASTIAELIVVQKPALLIPYPYATGGHQRDNAHVLSDIGAAVVVDEMGIKPLDIVRFLEDIVKNQVKLMEMSKNYSRLTINPLGAARKIADLIFEIRF